jgi:hypothetical protein
MTVVNFPPRPKQLPPGWQAAELQRLITACAGCVPSGAGSGWEFGQTERGDPQLYLIGPEPEHECILTISRLGTLYVLEDGNGRVLLEHGSLMLLTDQARAALRRRKEAIAARIVVTWCAAREFFEEKVEPVLAEPMEVITHFAPQLAALA